jgi:hypothetical protein
MNVGDLVFWNHPVKQHRSYGLVLATYHRPHSLAGSVRIYWFDQSVPPGAYPANHQLLKRAG